MSDSARLLQMLEPAARPVSAPGAVTRPAKQPFERQSFDQLLAAFGDGGLGTTASNGTPVAYEHSGEAQYKPSPPPLDLGGIENASLRRLIAQQHEPTAQVSPADRPAA